MDGGGERLQQPFVEKSCASLKLVGQDCGAFHKLFQLVVCSDLLISNPRRSCLCPTCSDQR
jgi:hypothetical protein